MQKWEYLVIERNKDEFGNKIISKMNGEIVPIKTLFHNILKEWGENGWELIAVSEEIYYFKRPLNSN